jgi:hypothetical protein
VPKAGKEVRDARVAADARGIFAQRDIAGVVQLVFDCPVVADGLDSEAVIDSELSPTGIPAFVQHLKLLATVALQTQSIASNSPVPDPKAVLALEPEELGLRILSSTG